MKALGVYRETTLAGKPTRDERILELTAQELKKRGFEVELRRPENLTSLGQYDLVFIMARSDEARQRLSELEAKGTLVINSPEAVAVSLNRELSYKKLEEATIKIPPTKIVALNKLKFHKNVVLKRTDRHEQWFIVKNEEQMKEAINFYRSQGIKRVVLQDFIDGSHLKFYVIGDRFFVQPIPREIAALTKTQAIKAGKAIGLEIYGGDFIVDDSQAYLVDLNDWPSFGSINGYTQEEAAREITEYLISRVKECE